MKTLREMQAEMSAEDFANTLDEVQKTLTSVNVANIALTNTVQELLTIYISIMEGETLAKDYVPGTFDLVRNGDGGYNFAFKPLAQVTGLAEMPKATDVEVVGVV